MVVHPGAGNQEHTLVNALLAHCTTLSGSAARSGRALCTARQGTSGCLVVAKNDATHRDLSRQFAARTVKKIYSRWWRVV
jgi:23S rRNA pseudouridine1911/1915/1917 synthase